MATPTSNPPPHAQAERGGAVPDDLRVTVQAGAVAERAPATEATPAAAAPAPHAATPGPARAAGPAAAGPAVTPAATGRGLPDLESAEAYRAKSRSRRKRFLLLIPILLIAVCASALFGYRYWYETTYFVSTENATVTGDLVQVGSLNAGPDRGDAGGRGADGPDGPGDRGGGDGPGSRRQWRGSRPDGWASPATRIPWSRSTRR